MSLAFICGTITAWAGQSGLQPLLPPWKRLLVGLLIAIGIGLLLGLLRTWLVDPIIEGAMSVGLPADEVDLHYPPTAYGVLALILWVAGFETLFFEGSTMSLWTRITRSTWIATTVTVLARVGVAAIQLNQIDLGRSLPAILLAGALGQLIACRIFVHGGLPAAMAYHAALQVGLILRLN